MANLRLGDTAPNFDATTTDGDINFHEWAGDSWVVFFSHPADYTPVCTTELGRTAALGGEFQKRNVKPIALSVDGLEDHKGWVSDIEETQGDAEITSTATAISRSEQGWKLFGLAWYWWVLIAVILVSGWLWTVRTYRAAGRPDDF